MRRLLSSLRRPLSRRKRKRRRRRMQPFDYHASLFLFWLWLLRWRLLLTVIVPVPVVVGDMCSDSSSALAPAGRQSHLIENQMDLERNVQSGIAVSAPDLAALGARCDAEHSRVPIFPVLLTTISKSWNVCGLIEEVELIGRSQEVIAQLFDAPVVDRYLILIRKVCVDLLFDLSALLVE
jgi:hypothetical protein